MNGLGIKRYIQGSSQSEVIVIKENLQFNITDLYKYKKYFKEMKEQQIITQGNFEDNVWTIKDEFKGSYNLKFNNKELNLQLKCFAITKSYLQKTSSGNVFKSLKYINDFLELSDNLDLKILVDVLDKIKYFSDSEKQGIYYIKEFIRYIDTNDYYIDYLRVLNETTIPKSKTRLIPNYRSILIFDNIINEFIDNQNIEESVKMKFYPLLMWWKLTTIIPLRPREFCILPLNCLIVKNNEYYIKIERVKNRNGVIKFSNIKKVDNFKINKDIYDLFTKYINMTKEHSERVYLLDYRMLINSYDENIRNRPLIKNVNKEIYDTNVLSSILKKFYDNIVSETYHYSVIEKEEETKNDNEIHRIQLGDTRHIAICSMLLQGFNPLTIAQMSGHETLREQFSYYGHLESYIDAHTMILAKSLRKDIKVCDFNVLSNAKKLDKILLKDEFYNLRKVDNGRCKSKNFPYECEVDNCYYCPNFILDNKDENNFIIHVLEEEIKKEIESKLECIKTIIKHSTKEFDENNYKTEINQLNTLINRESLLKGYKLKLNEL